MVSKLNTLVLILKYPTLKNFSNFINAILLSFHLSLIIYLENKKKKFDVVQYPSFLNFGIFFLFQIIVKNFVE